MTGESLGPVPLHWFLALSTGLDLLVAVGTLVSGRRSATGGGIEERRVGLIRVPAALLAAIASLAVKAALGRPLGLHVFGLVHLAYLACVVTVPTTGLVLLAGELGRRRRWGWRLSPGVRGLALLALLACPVGLWASFVEPFRLRVERPVLRVALARDGRGEVRIGILADIQTDRITRHEREAIDRLLAESPDLILIPGDLFQGTARELERELPALRRLLGRLAAPGGVWLVRGNVDPPPATLDRVLEGTAVRRLDGEVTSLRVGDRTLMLGGLAYPPGEDDHEVIQRLEGAPGAAEIRILVSHLPDAVYRLRRGTRIDLLVAGHTHGGQVQVPGWGPPMKLSRVPRSVAAGGLHDLSGRRIYVSRGLGWERGQAPRIRWACPPEVTLLTISDPQRAE